MQYWIPIAGLTIRLGWLKEGNIFWSTELFELIEYGAENISIIEELRRLFWVRLRPPGDNQQRTLFVSTAHFSWQGNKREVTHGISPRLTQARKTAEALQVLAPAPESLLFMGDLNDFMHPIRILHESGLIDSFSALGQTPVPTWPAAPFPGPPELDDWIFQRGPLRPMTSGVVDFYVDDFPPSDHKPLLATYRFL